MFPEGHTTVDGIKSELDYQIRSGLSYRATPPQEFSDKCFSTTFFALLNIYIIAFSVKIQGRMFS